MVKSEVETAVKFLEENKIPYTIVMDNMQRYSVNNGSTIIWNPEDSLGVCVRSNVGQDQAAARYELRTFCYDHIEAIEVHTSDVKKIVAYVSAMVPAKAEAITKVMGTYETGRIPTITGSTGDGIGDTWNGLINSNKHGGDVSTDGDLMGADYRRNLDYSRHQAKADAADTSSLRDENGSVLYDAEGNKIEQP